MKQADLVAGIDIGGTKTHILIKDADRVVADRVVASSDWRTWVRERDAIALATLIKDIAGGKLAQPQSAPAWPRYRSALQAA